MNSPIRAIPLPALIALLIGAVVLTPVMAMSAGFTNHICSAPTKECKERMTGPAQGSCCKPAGDGAIGESLCHRQEPPAAPAPAEKSRDSGCDTCPCCMVGPMTIAWAPPLFNFVQFTFALTHDEPAIPAMAHTSDWVHSLFHPPCL